jgi:hypothetical protein
MIHTRQDISLLAMPTMGQDFYQERQNFRFATHVVDNTVSGWLLFNSAYKQKKEVGVLLGLDTNKNSDQFIEYNYGYEREYNRLYRRDVETASGQVYLMLPGHLHGPGVRDFVDHLFEEQRNQRNVSLSAELVMSPSAFELLASLDSEDFRTQILSFIQTVFADQNSEVKEFGDLRLGYFTQPGAAAPECFDTLTSTNRSMYNYYARDIGTILRLTPLLTQSIHTPVHFWKIYTELQANRLFKTLGVGILSRLLMRACISNYDSPHLFYEHAKLYLSVINRDGLHYSYSEGSGAQWSNSSELKRIRNRILNRRYIPIYFAE